MTPDDPWLARARAFEQRWPRTAADCQRAECEGTCVHDLAAHARADVVRELRAQADAEAHADRLFTTDTFGVAMSAENARWLRALRARADAIERGEP